MDDLIYGLYLTYNTFDATSLSSSLSVGVSLSANIASGIRILAGTQEQYCRAHTQPTTQCCFHSRSQYTEGSRTQAAAPEYVRDWLFQFNDFRGVMIGIQFLHSPALAGGLSGMVMNYNSITVTTTMCPPEGCAALYSAHDNLFGLDATYNW